MKVKTPANHNPFGKRLLQIVKRRNFQIIFGFLAYNALLFGLGFSLFYNEVSHAMKAKISDKISSLKASVNIFENPYKGIQAEPKQFSLDIEEKDLQKLADIKNSYFLKESLLMEQAEAIPATLKNDGKTFQVEIGLQGFIPGNPLEADTWPLLVKVKDNDPFLGMKRFSIEPNQKPDGLQEWWMHQFLAEAGLISLHYDLVALSINGAKHQIYTIKEVIGETYHQKVDAKGPIINFWDTHWKSDNKNEERIKHSDPDAWLVKKANLLAVKFQEKELNASEVFDIPKLASYLALTDLFGLNHPANLDNLRFYYHPDRSVLIPMPLEKPYFENLKDHGLLGAERRLGSAVPIPSKFELASWHEQLFGDSVFFAAYVQALEKIAAPQFLDEIIEKYRTAFLSKQKILLQEKSGSRPDPIAFLSQNQEYIRRAIGPIKLLQVYHNKKKSSKNVLHFEVANIHNFPVEITGAHIGDTISLGFAQPPELVQANIQLSPVEVQTVQMTIPEAYPLSDSLLAGLKISCRILGSRRHIQEQLIPYAILDEELLEGDLMRQAPNVSDFAFLTVDEEQKQIQVKEGMHCLDKNLIIPKGYQVIADGGTSIDMNNYANILSYSPFRWIGNKEHPISFFSSDSTAQGITVLNASEESVLQFIHFDNLGNPNYRGWSLTSGITFYESPVSIAHCLFENNRLGDDYLNIVRCTYAIDHCVFFNANADAFDGDFSQGSIKNTQFINSGNDAIDVSGSDLAMENILIDVTGDKGISAGENSRMKIRNIKIKHAEIAVTSKDLSTIDIEDIEIHDSRIAYTAFQKKPEFGPAIINVHNRSTFSGQIELPYLIEHNSTLSITGEPVSSSIGVDYVKQILYGVKYGKSSQ